MFDRKIKIAKTPQVITESNFTARENNSTQNEHFNLVKNYTENPSSVLTQIPSDTFTEDMNPNVLKSIDIMNSIDNNDYWVIDTNNCIYTTITNQDNSTFEFLTTLAISSLKKYKKDTGFDIKKVFVENVGIYSKIILKDFNIDIIKNGSYDGVVTLPEIKVTSDSFFYENDTKSFGKTKYELLKDVVTKKESSYILLLNNTFYECLPFGGSSDLSYSVNYTDPNISPIPDMKNEMFIDEKGVMNFNYTNNVNVPTYFNSNQSGIKFNEILKNNDKFYENGVSIGFNDFNYSYDINGYANIQFYSEVEDGGKKRYHTIVNSNGLITTIDNTPVVTIDNFGIDIREGRLMSPSVSSPNVTGGKQSNFDTLLPADYVTKAYVDYAFGAGNPFDYTLKSYKYNQTNDTNNFFEIKYDGGYVAFFSDTKYNIIFRDVTNDRTTILNKKGLFINLKNDGLYVPYTEVSVDKIGIILELDLYNQLRSGSLLTATDLKIGTTESDRITIKKDSIEGSSTIKDYSTLYNKSFIQKKHLEDKIAELVARITALENQKIAFARKLTKTTTTNLTIVGNASKRILDDVTIVTGDSNYDTTGFILEGNTNKILKETGNDYKELAIAITVGHTQSMVNTKFEVQLWRNTPTPSLVRYGSQLVFDDPDTRGNTTQILTVKVGLNDPFVTNGYYIVLRNLTNTDFIYSKVDILITNNISKLLGS